MKTKILADFQIYISVTLKHCMKVVANVLILWQVAAVIVTQDESNNTLKKGLYKINMGSIFEKPFETLKYNM